MCVLFYMWFGDHMRYDVLFNMRYDDLFYMRYDDLFYMRYHEFRELSHMRTAIKKKLLIPDNPTS